MSLAGLADRWVLSLDRLLAKPQVAVCERKGCLLTIFFHSLFAGEAEVSRLTSDPQQAITVQQFRQVIEYFLVAGYICASPADVLQGLDPKRRYFMITFDDGYYNNHRSLPVLEELNVTATFFISTDHVRRGKAFWWDILYRAGKNVGQTIQEIYGSFAVLKRMPTEEVEASIEKRLGASVFKPVGEADRPFTPAELRDFSRSKHVFIGNHTSNHAILTNYSAPGVQTEIATAQRFLQEVTGAAPVAIAYPNGDFSSDIVQTAQACGLKLGFTTEARKDYIRDLRRSEKLMLLGRACPWGNDRLLQQCDYFRSDLALYERYQHFKKSLKAILRRKH